MNSFQRLSHTIYSRTQAFVSGACCFVGVPQLTVASITSVCPQTAHMQKILHPWQPPEKGRNTKVPFERVVLRG